MQTRTHQLSEQLNAQINEVISVLHNSNCTPDNSSQRQLTKKPFNFHSKKSRQLSRSVSRDCVLCITQNSQLYQRKKFLDKSISMQSLGSSAPLKKKVCDTRPPQKQTQRAPTVSVPKSKRGKENKAISRVGLMMQSRSKSQTKGR